MSNFRNGGKKGSGNSINIKIPAMADIIAVRVSFLTLVFFILPSFSFSFFYPGGMKYKKTKILMKHQDNTKKAYFFHPDFTVGFGISPNQP
jgi:hypothetical protein